MGSRVVGSSFLDYLPSMPVPHRLPLLLLGSVSLGLTLACAGVGSGDTGKDGPQSSEDAVAEYVAVAQALEENRTEVLDESAQNLGAVGNRLFWTGSSYDPILHSYEHTSGVEVDYEFSIGSGDLANDRASTEAIATAIPGGGNVVYHVYDIARANDALDTFALPMPTNAQWWAYAVVGTDVYYAVDDDETVLWRKGAGVEAERVVSLQSDCDLPVGEFWDFTMDGAVALVVESGRVWRVDLSGGCTAIWLENETEVQSFSYDDDGVLYSSATGPFYWDVATGETTDIAAMITRADYHLNDTFATAHLYNEGTVALWTHYAIYHGNSGIFALDLRSGAVSPILLDNPYTGDTYVTYRDPTVLDDGTLFVQSLESTDGATGADGPIYAVDWTP